MGKLVGPQQRNGLTQGPALCRAVLVLCAKLTRESVVLRFFGRQLTNALFLGILLSIYCPFLSRTVSKLTRLPETGKNDCMVVVIAFVYTDEMLS